MPFPPTDPPRGKKRPGAFVISLDFELRWGIHDVMPIEHYRENLLGARVAVPAILSSFERSDVHATWATVGFLFADGRRQLEAAAPTELPTYADKQRSPYLAVPGLGATEQDDPLSFAPSLVKLIAQTPHQELASHTFSHYYALEAGQTSEQFRADLLAARAIGAPYGDVIRSLVLPRNQWNPSYRPVLQELGVKAYRISRPHWGYDATTTAGENRWRRAFRLVDSHVRLSGSTAEPWPPAVPEGEPAELVASAFLRPHSPSLRAFEGARLRRILGDMSHAARDGLVFHLWWHPHNFGRHLGHNLAFLEAILAHFRALRNRHGMVSLGMAEVATSCRDRGAL